MNCEIEVCDKCSGCSACSAICPEDAIIIKRNFEGFYTYEIDSLKCVKCGLCKKVCPEANYVFGSTPNPFLQKYYACRNIDLSCVEESSSGGVFSALAQAVIDKGGSVYGVVINYPSCEIVYKRATIIEETYPMRGSKYIQAKLTKDILDQIVQDTNSNIPILFTGTSCYVNGVKRLLEIKRIEANNIYYMDFVCTGVISPKIWDKEIEDICIKYGKIDSFSFRCKKMGWRDSSIFFKSGKIEKNIRFTISNIGQFQAKNEALGIACNKCNYRSYEKPGDITVGDFWNEQYLPHEWWDDKGVSSILVNSEKGSALLKESQKYLKLFNVEKKMVYNVRFEQGKNGIDYNNRTALYTDIEKMDYDDFANKWIHIGLKDWVLLTFVRPIFIKLGMHRLKYSVVQLFEFRTENEKA